MCKIMKLLDVSSTDISQSHSKGSEPCRFLRLPIEIRLQIYAYTNIVGNTIEVLNLRIIRSQQELKYYPSYSTDPADHELLYRLEVGADKRHEMEYPRVDKSEATPFKYVWGGLFSRRRQLPTRKMCFSVHGLFALTSVCRQIRAETHLLVYEHNEFAFAKDNYNYRGAIRALIRTLTEREASAIRTICWPLADVVQDRSSLRGKNLDGPQRDCFEELRALKGLKKVVLRQHMLDSGYKASNYTAEENEELNRRVAERSREAYSVQRIFVREIAVQDTKRLIRREDVQVECIKFHRRNSEY